jgi:hypothetical protein
MKPGRFAISVALLALTALSPLWAQRVELLIDEGDKVKDAPEKTYLEYRFLPGELRRYDVTVQGDGSVKLPGQKEKAKLLSYTTMTFMEHVKSFHPTEGNWRIEWDMLKGQMTIPEFGDMLLTVPPLDFDMDKYGAVQNIKGIEDLTVSPGLPQGKVFGDILKQLRAVGFPHKALVVGDKWEDKYTVKVPDQAPVTITCVSKLIGYERVLKTDCAKILTTYTTPFELKIPQEPAADSKSEGTPGGQDAKPSDTEQKPPIILKGQEKAEFWTHFSYNDGKLMQSFGSIELSADIAKEGAAADPAKTASTAAPAKEEPKPVDLGKGPAPDLLIKQPEHDLYVKFQMISKHNPEIPKSMDEVDK